MSAEQHRHEADTADLSIRITVIVVSSSRTAKTDTSGQAIADRLASAGHRAIDRLYVDDDIEAIRKVVARCAAEDVSVVILTGGTGVTGRDVTPEALAPMLKPELPGFGELFRALSFQEVGAAAMLSRATAGLCGRTVVFALPGSRSACELAIDKLILPELAHLVHLARKDRENVPVEPIMDVPFEPVAGARKEEPQNKHSKPETFKGDPSTGAGTKLSLGEVPIERPAVAGEEPAWVREVTSWGATILRETREPIPEEIEKIAPVFEVLYRAGAIGTLVLGDGSRYSLFGWPDLLRTSSKVLAVRVTDQGIAALALHRWPKPTGTCTDGTGPLPPRSADVEALAIERTGRPIPGEPGELFAIASDAVWILRGRRVSRWDGRRESDCGTPNQALASLVLEWSQR